MSPSPYPHMLEVVSISTVGTYDFSLVHDLGREILDRLECDRVYVGRQVENPDVLMIFCEIGGVDVDTFDRRRDSYHDIFNQQRFRAIFGSTSPDSKTDSHGGVLKIFHANLGPLPPNVAIVPNTNGDYVTEVGVGYFKADITQADRQAWLDLQEKHERENMVPWKGYLAYSGGWTVENLPKPRGGEHEHAASISTKPYLGLWAWTSKETHDECAAREVWQEVTKPIGEFPGFLDVDMYHVRMVEVQKQKSAGNQ